MKAISIIIPVYNSEQYIGQIITSILNQRFTDFELILVDDGSTDASPGICQTYAAADDRVILINQINSGPSKARNNGITRAEGKYILFMDSDDEITDGALGLLHDAIEGHGCDLVIAGFEYVYSQEGRVLKREKKHIHLENMHDRESVIQGILKENDTAKFNYVWNKIYRTGIIKNHCIRFDETCAYAEDILFNTRYLRHTTSICILDSVIYSYHIRLNCRNSLSLKPREDLFENAMLIIRSWENLLMEQQVKNEDVAANLRKLYIRRTDLLLNSIINFRKEISFMKIISKILTNSEIKNAYASFPTLPEDFRKTVNQKIRFFMAINSRYLLALYLLILEMKNSLKRRISSMLTDHGPNPDDVTGPFMDTIEADRW